ncbi:MAG: 3-oxoacyl-ACP reductase family protein [Candidatus Methanomethylicia archaeon]
MRLKDRVSLVTGGSRGIGRAIALTFAREGSYVAINYVRNREKAEEVVNEITGFGGRAIAIQANVAVRDDVFKMVNKILEEFGRIDILVNNAGITLRNTNILEASDDEWREIINVNLLGVYYCIQAVAPHMIKQHYGKIINISSIAGIGTTIRGHVAYASSKAAINILTRRFAYELGPYNINVNAIAPGLIKTEMLSLGRSEEELMKFIKEKINVTALRRIGDPQDVANTALFLASDESSFITGQIIVVDGGRFDYLTHSI